MHGALKPPLGQVLFLDKVEDYSDRRLPNNRCAYSSLYDAETHHLIPLSVKTNLFCCGGSLAQTMADCKTFVAAGNLTGLVPSSSATTIPLTRFWTEMASVKVKTYPWTSWSIPCRTRCTLSSTWCRMVRCSLSPTHPRNSSMWPPTKQSGKWRRFQKCTGSIPTRVQV